MEGDDEADRGICKGQNGLMNPVNMNDTSFIIHARGVGGRLGVFEDDGESGYLYLYEPQGRKVLRHLHIYDRTRNLDVSARDVQVTWSSDGTKVGVVIWGKMRGIIDTQNDRDGRVWLESRDTPGIADRDWLRGFGTSS